MAPTVSINLCCYNSEKYLRETLQSIINQTYTDWELIIINDGSSDSTESIIHEYIKQGYPIIYHYQENKGLGYSRNEALKRSQGEFIAFIDHDDIWMPHKLESQIKIFASNQLVGLVYSDYMQVNEFGAKVSVYKKAKPLKGKVFRKLLVQYPICLSSVVIRKDALCTLQEWFDPRFNFIEEADLFKRIAHDWEIDYADADEPLVLWRVHSDSITSNRSNLQPRENELLLAKFRKLYDGFDRCYRKEILIMESNIQYHYALYDWSKGNRKIVRKRLKPYLLKRKKLIAPFFSSFLMSHSMYLKIAKKLKHI